MGRFLTNAEWTEELWNYERTAFRLELQPAYSVGEEADVERFAAGDRTPPNWDYWCGRVAAARLAGKRIERVRVFEDPPTIYQEWLRWASRLTAEAGEDIRYMTRRQAFEVGLLPSAGGLDDWWLFDSSRLMVMRFDEVGHLLTSEIVDDPERVAEACTWWDLAFRHSIPDTRRGAST